jgi:hypothetical protein
MQCNNKRISAVALEWVTINSGYLLRNFTKSPIVFKLNVFDGYNTICVFIIEIS